MKKLIIIFCALCCLTLASCKSEAAQAVDDMILAIGEVTLDSKDAIVEAEKAVQALSEEDREQVRYTFTLSQARKDYDDLVEINEIETAINAIGSVTIDQEPVIIDARNQYNNARPEISVRVTNYKILDQAIKELSNLKIQNVIDLIDQIGEITLDNEEKIEFAKNAYDALSISEQEKVTNHRILVGAVNTIERIKTEEKLKNIVKITKVQVSKPNSAGGVDLYIGFKNISDKTIKYITFEVVPFNAVGDAVRCEIRGYINLRGRSTGPYTKGEGLVGNNSEYWDCAWYSYDITDVKLIKIDIEYMDGTTESISGDNLDYVF